MELDAHHEAEEKANDKRQDLIDERVEEINDCDSEQVFVKYASDLADIVHLYHDAPDFKERLVKELNDCIYAEARGDIDHRLLGE